jgi:chromosome segregation ATPase
MAPGKNKKNDRIQGSSRKDQFVVLLENMRDEIKLVAEGNLMLQERMESGFKEVKGDIEGIKDGLIVVKMDLHGVKQDLNLVKEDLNSVKQDLNSVKQDLNLVKEDLNSVKQDLNLVKEDVGSVKEEMHAGFKSMIAESAKNNEVLAKKADGKELLLLEKRVLKLEIVK